MGATRVFAIVFLAQAALSFCNLILLYKLSRRLREVGACKALLEEQIAHVEPRKRDLAGIFRLHQ